LFELLTGRHPYPLHKKRAREAILAMLADRKGDPPRLRGLNPAVSPATEAVIRKCLEGDPAKRYQKAEDLREDLNRQLNGLPLRHAPNPSRRERFGKWVRRHPRLTSSGSVAAAAAVLLLAVGAGAVYSRERAHNLNAHALFLDHQTSFEDARLVFDDRNQSRADLDGSLARLRALLDQYQLTDTPDAGWVEADAVRRLPEPEQAKLRINIGEVFYLMAEIAILQASAAAPQSPEEREYRVRAERWHANAVHFAEERLPWALRDQKQGLGDLREGRGPERKTEELDPAKMDSPRDLYLLGTRLTQRGEHRRGLPFLQRATQLDPRDFSAWFVRGTTHLALSQFELGAMCFSSCLAIRSNFAPAWRNRGRAFIGLRFFELAVPDYDRAIELNPKSPDAYIQRATARDALHDSTGAEADLTRALGTGAAPVQVYFLRSEVRRRLGKKEAADEDRQTGLRLRPADELSWIGRAEMRLEKNPEGALADVEEALKLNPFSMFALQTKSHILSERLNRPNDSIAVLDLAVKFHPDHAPLRAGRGVLLARAGNRKAALQDARDALRRDTRAPNLYQVGCIYALTSAKNPEDRPEAVKLLWEALKTGFGMDWVDGDTDLDPLRTDRTFREMVAEAKVLARARKK
jgi:eukaryotic-like serine/threonine-protein kinase